MEQQIKLGTTVLEKLFELGAEAGKTLFIAVLILVIGLKLANHFTKVAKTMIEKSSINDSVGSFLLSFIKIGLKILVFILVVIQLGVDGSSFIAIIGSFGVALSLALQGSLSNIAGGFLILLLKPFEVGDYIIEDSHKNEGTVIAIDLFYTRIETIDNKMIVIPNSVVTAASLTNVTKRDERMLDLRFGIGYQDDIREAKKIMEDIAIASDTVLRKDSITVFVDSLDDSCVTLGLRAWVPTGSYNPARWELNEKIKVAFDEYGINIPYNQMDVHVIKDN